MKLLRVMGCESIQYGSMERYLVRLTQRAAERGHRSVIAYNAPPRVSAFPEDVRRAGGELISLNLDARMPATAVAGRLAALLRRERPDVLHGYFTPFCHMAMASGALMGIERRFRTSANMPWSARPDAGLGSVPTRAFCLKQRLLSRLPRQIVALSRVMKEEFHLLGVPDERVVVIHGGVDSDYFTPDHAAGRQRVREEWGVAPGDRLVGYVGRLVPIKAVHVLLDAAARVVHEIPRARLVVVGDGPLRGALEARARTLGLESRCRFLGHRTDVRDVLAALDVAALCSLSEGMSNSLLEAMATGLPAVASFIPANAEVVVDGETGLLFSPGDVAGCATALRRVLADEALAAELGRRARSHVERSFSLDRRVAAELDLYTTH